MLFYYFSRTVLKFTNMKIIIQIVLMALVLTCASCFKKKKKEDVSCDAVLTVTNNTGFALNYAWGSNMLDSYLPIGGKTTLNAGHINITYSKNGNETSHTSYIYTFNSDHSNYAITVDECNESYSLE